MAKSRLLHPHFFQTLVPGFNTHLMIPSEFFSKYIKGRNLENKTTAQLKSDSSDVTWKVKMTGRRLSDGWREFAVANKLQMGEVLLVKYEGEMVFRVSDLGSSCCEIQDIPSPRNNLYGQDDIGKTLSKKRLYPRTQVDFSSNDDDDVRRRRRRMRISLLPLKKKTKISSPEEAEAVSSPPSDNSSLKKKMKNSPQVEAEAVSSSPSDNSCFVAFVAASNLRTDKLYLPQDFTSSNGLTRKCRKIVLTDGGDRSWALDLMFDESSDTFYISRGWRSFCDENVQKAGGFFTFTLKGNGEIPVLSFSPTESYIDKRKRDCSKASGKESFSTELSNKNKISKDENNKEERRSCKMEKNHLRWRDSTPSSIKQFVTLTISHSSFRKCRLYLPKRFPRENDITKPEMIALLGKDGIKRQAKLVLDKANGIMYLGGGWKVFAEANDLKLGDSFTLKLKWEEDTTPVLCLCSDRKQEEFSPSSQKQFARLTITPNSVEKCVLPLPKRFTRENDITEPGIIALLGKDGIKHQAKLISNKGKGSMYLGSGWKVFAEANDIKLGDSFTLKLIWEGKNPVLSLCPAECSVDRSAEGGYSETNQKKYLPIDNNIEERSKDETSEEENDIEKSCKEENNIEQNRKEEYSLWEREKNHMRHVDSSSEIQTNRFVTLTLTPEDVRACKLHLPRQFMRANGINKLGKITLVGEKNKMEWSAYLLTRDGTVALGNGWDEFCEANGVKLGESFTLEFICQEATNHLFKFCSNLRDQMHIS